jgi:hypothetical protein
MKGIAMNTPKRATQDKIISMKMSHLSNSRKTKKGRIRSSIRANDMKKLERIKKTRYLSIKKIPSFRGIFSKEVLLKEN